MGSLVPAMLPSALLPRQAVGTLEKSVRNLSARGILSLSTYIWGRALSIRTPSLGLPWCFPLCRVEVRGGGIGARSLAGSEVVEKRKSKFFFFGIEWFLEASE